MLPSSDAIAAWQVMGWIQCERIYHLSALSNCFNVNNRQTWRDMIYEDYWRLVSLIPWIGYNQTIIHYSRAAVPAADPGKQWQRAEVHARRQMTVLSKSMRHTIIRYSTEEFRSLVNLCFPLTCFCCNRCLNRIWRYVKGNAVHDHFLVVLMGNMIIRLVPGVSGVSVFCWFCCCCCCCCGCWLLFFCFLLLMLLMLLLLLVVVVLFFPKALPRLVSGADGRWLDFAFECWMMTTPTAIRLPLP